MASGGLGALAAVETAGNGALGFTELARNRPSPWPPSPLWSSLACTLALRSRQGQRSRKAPASPNNWPASATIFASRHFWRYAPMGFCLHRWLHGRPGTVGVALDERCIEALDARGGRCPAHLDQGLAMLGRFPVHGLLRDGKLVHRGMQAGKALSRARCCMAFAACSHCISSLQPQFAGATCCGRCLGHLLLVVEHFLLTGRPGLSRLQWSGRANTAFNLLVFARRLRPAVGHRRPHRRALQGSRLGSAAGFLP
jgi:hypothetical protein